MTYRLVILPKAIAQAAKIHAYYKTIKPDLAARFANEFDECMAFIEKHPGGFQVRSRNYRHAYIVGFQYRVVYAIRGEDVVVYQVRHTRRRPSKRFGP
jgi:plasmid stabilization system protein ParE